jgi:hypothetical protein
VIQHCSLYTKSSVASGTQAGKIMGHVGEKARQSPHCGLSSDLQTVGVHFTLHLTRNNNTKERQCASRQPIKLKHSIRDHDD